MPASRPPAAPSRWPVIDLVDDTASLSRVVAEAALDGQRLERVVVRRRGAVRVDVVDLRRARCRRSRAPSLITRTRAVAVLGRRGDVVRVGRHAVADQLGVDRARRAPARARAPRGSATPAPSPTTKPSRSLSNGRLARSRLVVARRQRAQRAEAADAHRRDRRLGAAGDHRRRRRRAG